MLEWDGFFVTKLGRASSKADAGWRLGSDPRYRKASTHANTQLLLRWMLKGRANVEGALDFAPKYETNPDDVASSVFADVDSPRGRNTEAEVDCCRLPWLSNRLFRTGLSAFPAPLVQSRPKSPSQFGNHFQASPKPNCTVPSPPQRPPLWPDGIACVSRVHSGRPARIHVEGACE